MCKIPAEPKESAVGLDVEQVSARHRAMSDLLAMALVCNQTKVFNMVYSDSGSSLTRKGLDKTHHAFTHEEPVNPDKGYQIHSFEFVGNAMKEWGYFVRTSWRPPQRATARCWIGAWSMPILIARSPRCTRSPVCRCSPPGC